MGLCPNHIFAAYEIKRCRGIIAAVSGGSDSLGLLFLLKDYLAQLNNPPQLMAVTVDHQLRKESRDEAELVAALCKAQQIEHRILAWDEAKPASGISAAARSARYRLLVQAAKEAGADMILTGHTRDDQIETFLMRQSRSTHSQARGLAAMARRSRLENSVELIRPLLEISRQSLRAELQARGIGWVDDPSNHNAEYERPRIRLQQAKDVDPDLILAKVALAKAARKKDNSAVISALADPACLKLDSAGAFLVDAQIYAQLPENPRRLFAGLLTSLAGGRRFLPGDAERMRIENMLTGQESRTRLTVLGALIERGENGEPHRFCRERRNLPVVNLSLKYPIIWDGRYCFFYKGNENFEIRAPGRQELLDYMKSHAIELNKADREALLVLPALYKEGKLAHLIFGKPAHLHKEIRDQLEIKRHFALYDHVLTGYDFGLAAAVERRIGRECFDFSKPDS
ncbi:tRNA lysidine(34) synthetase TilS [Falsochrobactrum ovis]|uniref:tRNA(Ile)-lysidine synthase n=1 Tax=Falsochrobactrum ovis TaxID=1293442 RepID=A0A364JVW4_9HYPH|nr:tRNA lysidine(34) synthetase TilS [Falsochrobactrum ovis]RAK29979.1 tRNA(Ile)-lysidine synthase [Falsochrobactrum ovis]